ncbi:MAG: hypothetical protein ABSF71_39555 [Terriglobia bacterium]
MTPEERWEKIEKNQTVMQDQIIVTARMQQEGEKRWANQTADVWEGFAQDSPTWPAPKSGRTNPCNAWRRRYKPWLIGR